MRLMGLETITTEQVRETPLIERHRTLGARLIPFAGWLMPIQYGGGILHEHRKVRSEAGLFDLGHMGQVDVKGADALAYLQSIASNDVARLKPGEALYALMTNLHGGVIDDIIIYRRPDDDGYMVVINAANRDKDVAWMRARREATGLEDLTVEDISDATGMIAIQGPRAERIAQSLANIDLGEIGGFQWAYGVIAGIPAAIARTGYTGEDGFEFYPAIEQTAALWDALMAAGAGDGLEPIGLGARDTLRLEARMPLYGNELADDISPLEAGLGWAVSLGKGPFSGHEQIAAMKETGAPRRTVGFRLVERSGSARHGFPVALEGRTVGHVTSGGFSPTLGEQIGLALIEREAAGIGKPLDVIIRGKAVRAEQVKLPFYKRTPVEQSAPS